MDYLNCSSRRYRQSADQIVRRLGQEHRNLDHSDGVTGRRRQEVSEYAINKRLGSQDDVFQGESISILFNSLKSQAMFTKLLHTIYSFSQILQTVLSAKVFGHHSACPEECLLLETFCWRGRLFSWKTELVNNKLFLYYKCSVKPLPRSASQSLLVNLNYLVRSPKLIRSSWVTQILYHRWHGPDSDPDQSYGIATGTSVTTGSTLDVTDSQTQEKGDQWQVGTKNKQSTNLNKRLIVWLTDWLKIYIKK